MDTSTAMQGPLSTECLTVIVTTSISRQTRDHLYATTGTALVKFLNAAQTPVRASLSHTPRLVTKATTATKLVTISKPPTSSLFAMGIIETRYKDCQAALGRSMERVAIIAIVTLHIARSLIVGTPVSVRRSAWRIFILPFLPIVMRSVLRAPFVPTTQATLLSTLLRL